MWNLPFKKHEHSFQTDPIYPIMKNDEINRRYGIFFGGNLAKAGYHLPN